MRAATGAGSWMRRAAVPAVVLVALVGCSPSPPPSSPSPSPASLATSTPTTAPTPTPAATPTPTPTPAPDAGPLPEGAVTALLLGTDSRTPDSFEGNADAIVIVQLSADRETLALISVTRDSWVTIPGVGESKINAAFARGGAELMQATLSELLGGLEFDYVLQTGFDGFVGLIEAVDGVTVDNATPAIARYSTRGEVSETGIAYDFTADPIDLVDQESILFVRQRYGLPYGDLDRTERTRATIIGLLERLDELAADPPALTAALVHIMAQLRITGELQVADLVALTELSGTLQRDDILSLMAPIEGSTGRAGASVNVVDAARSAELGEALRAGDVQSYVDRYGTDYP
ncbi:LCP family protein [Agrococcus sp. ARC_14]|uniref:LCP family protein n=1 Tax=Agrococcus sp. ARC_14 TaxID=2919927 RepID=UPI001F064504|nr:LCP family protein [Agrococcus sp. ARC_14]MCH1883684.1 LCP family protein [Agrococcus sp. ARC_14]